MEYLTEHHFPLQNIFHQNGWVLLLNSQNSPFWLQFAALNLPRKKSSQKRWNHFWFARWVVARAMVIGVRASQNLLLHVVEQGGVSVGSREKIFHDLESFGKHTTQDGEISKDGAVNGPEILLAHQLMLVYLFHYFLGFWPSQVVIRISSINSSTTLSGFSKISGS